MEHINKKFDKELENLISRLRKMGKLVQTEQELLLEYFQQPKVELIQKIKTIEQKTDKLQVATYAKSIRITATRQPIASDLRLISGVARSIDDLERMADEMLLIAKYVEKANQFNKEGFRKFNDSLTILCEFNIVALNNTLHLYSNFDNTSAVKLAGIDSEIEKQFKKKIKSVTAEVIVAMKQRQDYIELGLNLVLAIRVIERIGAHITNLAEQIIYAERGIDARHGNVESL